MAGAAADATSHCAPARAARRTRCRFSTGRSLEPQIAAGDAPHIIIGTHALLYEGVSFQNLGLVVIDEQHKFGVSQRARLTAREPAPDVLVMTATPIPRTLTMTVYGDLDVSIIDEMPANRGKIITAVREDTKLGEVLAFLRKELEAGRQAYVIYPLIEESDKLDVKAAAAEFELWCERLRPFRCDLLHGRIPAPEKQAIMERFRRGRDERIDQHHGDRSGCGRSQRYGHVGGKCGALRARAAPSIARADRTRRTQVLLHSLERGEISGDSGEAAVLEKTSNGFEVAEADWDQRGPGDLLGTAQSGLPALEARQFEN